MSFEKIGYYTRNGENYTFNYKTNLTMVEKLTFVNNVTSYIVGDFYNYIARNMFFDFQIIKTFTDYDITGIIESNYKIAVIEQLISETNIADVVKENIESDLLEELYEAVSLNIEYKTGIHADQTKIAINNFINAITKKIDAIDEDVIVKFAKIFSEHADEFTPDKIITAYQKSDVYKDKFRELEKIQKEKMKSTLKEIQQNSGLKVLNND